MRFLGEVHPLQGKLRLTVLEVALVVIAAGLVIEVDEVEAVAEVEVLREEVGALQEEDGVA
jgi:alpha-D-ribose 1-methylphosphonate 5-triphosphate synthase subunit PhnI